MSFQPVIPGGLLSSRARFRFTGRSHSATAAQCWYTLFQPTEGVPFLVCLIHGGKCRSCQGSVISGQGSGPEVRSQESGHEGRSKFSENLGRASTENDCEDGERVWLARRRVSPPRLCCRT